MGDGIRPAAATCWVLAAAILAAAMAGCGRQDDRASDTAVLGGYGPRTSGEAALSGLPPPPGVPRNVRPEIQAAGPQTALAVWEDEGRVMAARHERGSGWDVPRPLEEIGGQSSNVRLAANGAGAAMAIWQHTVGRIDSLRYSRWEAASGWSEPDVMPGALPRPRQPGKTAGASVDEAAPRLEIDADGNVRAEWLSGFDENQMQASTFVPGEGWARPVDLPLQAAVAPSAAAR